MRPIRVVLLLLILGGAAGGHLNADDRVLIIQSYHETFEWTAKVNEAITAALDASSIPHRTIYMDTKRKPSQATINQAAARAIHLIKTYAPKVVIAVDDNAQLHVVKHYVDKAPPQIVFCGVNADPGEYGYPAANVTGILERTYPDQSLSVLHALVPSVKNIAVISDTSPSADLVLKRFRSMAQKGISGLNIVSYHRPAVFADWKKTVVDLDNNRQVDAILIILYHTVRNDGSLDSVDSNEVMAWTRANTRKPLAGIGSYFIRDGGLVAVAVNPFEHGKGAARMAIEILKGQSAGDIPMIVNHDGNVMVNLRDNTHVRLDVSVNIDQVANEIIR